MVQRKELDRELFRMRRLNAGLASRPKEPLQPSVPEALDHLLSVAHHASGGKPPDEVTLIASDLLKALVEFLAFAQEGKRLSTWGIRHFDWQNGDNKPECR